MGKLHRQWNRACWFILLISILHLETILLHGQTDTSKAKVAVTPDTSVSTTSHSRIESNRQLHPETLHGKELLPMDRKKTKFAYFDTTHSIDRVVINNAFDIGEKLVFIIRYGLVVAGTATMEIPTIRILNNRECFHILTLTKSNKFFSTFFKVEDKVESFMDKNGLFSWRHEKHLREGKYRADQFVDLDHVQRLAITNKKDSLRIPPCVQDILTSFYYVRTLPMEIGSSLFIDNYADRKLYPLEVKIHGKERIKVKAGTFDCLIVEPLLRSDAIFKQRGRLKIWMTDDARKIPVQMKSEIMIGAITAELERMEGVLPADEQVKIQRNRSKQGEDLLY